MSDLVAEIRARHVEDIRPWHTEIDGKPVYRTSCVFCLGVWPCDAAKAAAEIERLQAQPLAAADALEMTARVVTSRWDTGNVHNGMLIRELHNRVTAYRAARQGSGEGA